MVKRFRGRKAASLLALSIAAAMVITPSANALAAPLVVPPASTSTALNRAGAVKDQATLNKMYLMVYSEAYYAEKNPDLVKYYNDNPSVAARFGSMSAWLKWHYLTYGVNEDRDISPIIDINAYRKGNPDLAKAFGDKRVEYLKHFVTYGLYENVDGQRTNAGFKINVVLYLQSYADLAKAYGTDYLAACQHYAQYGRVEGRTKGTSADPRSGITLSNTNTSSSSSSSSNNGGGGGNGSGGNSGGGSGSGGNGGGGGQQPGGGGGVNPPAEPTLPGQTTSTVITADPSKTTEVTVANLVDVTGSATTNGDGKEEFAVTLDASALGDNNENLTAAIGTPAAGQVIGLTVNATGKSEDITKVTIPKAVVEALKDAQTAANPVAAITVKSDNGTVTVPVEALEKAGSAASVDLVFTKLAAADLPKDANDGNKVKDSQGNVVDTTKSVVVSVELSDVTVDNLTNSNIQITVAPPTGVTAGNVSVYYVKNGALEFMGVAAVTTDSSSNKIVSFGTNHLTDFALIAHDKNSGTKKWHTLDMFDAETGQCRMCDLTLTAWQQSAEYHDHGFAEGNKSGTCNICGLKNFHVDDHKTIGVAGVCATCGKDIVHEHTAESLAAIPSTLKCPGCDTNGTKEVNATNMAACSKKDDHATQVGTCTECGFVLAEHTQHVGNVNEACSVCKVTIPADAIVASGNTGEAATMTLDVNNLSTSDKSGGKTIDATNVENASGITLTVKAAAITALSNGKNVTVQSTMGDIVIPKAALQAAQTAGEDVVVTIKKTDMDGSTNLKSANALKSTLESEPVAVQLSDNAIVIEIGVKATGGDSAPEDKEALSSMNKMTVTIDAPKNTTTNEAATTVKVYVTTYTTERTGSGADEVTTTTATLEEVTSTLDNGKVTFDAEKEGDYVINDGAVTAAPPVEPTGASLQNDAAAIKEEEPATEPEPAPQNGEGVQEAGGTDETPAAEVSEGE